MSQIIKTKFLCRNGSRRGSGTIPPITWIDIYIEGKWYDGEYETYDWEDGYRVNGAWRRYWVVNELGEREQILKAEFKVIFETKVEELRDNKIDQILNND
jgi:hypothetical protein